MNRDLLTKALAGTALSAGAMAALPEESESATLTKAAQKYFGSLWQKAHPERAISPKQWKNIESWASIDTPARMGVATPATDANDLKLLRAAASHPNYPDLNPETINTLRTTQAAIPEFYHREINPDIEYLQTQNPKHGGQYRARVTGVKPDTVLYNFEASRDLSTTPAHELVGHGTIMSKRIRPFLQDDVKEELAKVRASDSFLHTKSGELKAQLKQDPNIAQEKTDEINKALAGLYMGMPSEQIAHFTGDVFSRGVKTSAGLDYLRDENNFLKNIKPLAEQALGNLKKSTVPELAEAYDYARKNWQKFLAVPAAIGAYSAMPDNEGNAATLPEAPQETSNIDKTPMPAANVMLGNPEEGIISEGLKSLPGKVAAGAKVVGSIAGGILEDVGRSALKIADQGRSGKEFTPEPKDYATVAAMALNPTSKAGLVAADLALDWFNPPELNAVEVPE
jgi:hypothetical protein